MAAIITHSGAGKGAAGEELAARYLQQQGLRVLQRNFRVRGGEIDIICRDAATLVFVEVRCRSRSDFGAAAETIGVAKQRRITLAARHWLARHGEAPCRFDCVVIDGGRLQWLRDAFTAGDIE